MTLLTVIHRINCGARIHLKKALFTIRSQYGNNFDNFQLHTDHNLAVKAFTI